MTLILAAMLLMQESCPPRCVVIDDSPRQAIPATLLAMSQDPPKAVTAPQVLRDSSGRIKRSESAKNRFKRLNPCPANGRDRGPCPGYVIDHIYPLACGGADSPENMQWQTKPAAKEKDGWELKLPGCPAKFSRWKRFTRAMNPGEKP